MKETIFSRFGIEVVKRDNHWFISYDSGEIASAMKESEITEDESIEVQASPSKAHEVILRCQKRGEHLA